ncbi:MAG: hypothetical protein ACI4PJ_00130, partial [Acutalibacteraceae bacterium]
PRFTAEYKEKFIKSGKKLHLKSLSEASDTLVLSCYKDRDGNASITIGDIPTPDVPSEDVTTGAITMFFSCDREHIDCVCASARDCFLKFFANSTRQLVIGCGDGYQNNYRYFNLVK